MRGLRLAEVVQLLDRITISLVIYHGDRFFHTELQFYRIAIVRCAK